MRYYVKDIPKSEGAEQTAYTKARADADAILDSLGFYELEVKMPFLNRQTNHFFSKIACHWKVYKAWCKCVDLLKNNDVLLVQFPCIEHSIFLYRLFRKLSKSGVVILLLIHDIELLRVSEENNTSLIRRIRIQLEEKTILNQANKIIVHNKQMARYMSSLGIDKNKLVQLGLFDYLVDNYDSNKIKQGERSNDLPIVIAGNLSKRKAGYIYKLPDKVSFNLYGVYYSGSSTDTISYKGSFAPNDLPYALSGSFGLVWDGDSIETCSGVFGSYLKINNPHKLSLYLVSGMPIIIWSHAALASFVIENDVGITVDSLLDLKSAIEKISVERYAEMSKNAEKIGERLRHGVYLKRAIDNCQLN